MKLYHAVYVTSVLVDTTFEAEDDESAYKFAENNTAVIEELDEELNDALEEGVQWELVDVFEDEEFHS